MQCLVAGLVERLRQRWRPLPAGVIELRNELGVHVPPFGQPQIGHEAGAAGFDLAPVRQAALDQVHEEFPERHQLQEVRALVAEQQVGLVGRRALVQRPLA